MAEANEKISELEARLESLVRTQIDFQVEITAIRKELTRLRNLAPGGHLSTPPAAPITAARRVPPPAAVQPPIVTAKIDRSSTREVPPPQFSVGTGQTGTGRASTARLSEQFDAYKENAQADLERFIGENLISKIGIVVLILGVGIGVKYAIDNDLISPLTRIILGYAFGLSVVGIALPLKAKYLNFSAVLASGGLAILYFVTYFAYSAYGLVTQTAAFGLMTVLTVATVGAALIFRRQIIAHIGLVGAYAVPFLLSDDSGNYMFLFTYMAILNAGILAISVRRAWLSIFYTASGFTWLILAAWALTKYSPQSHFYLGLMFAGVFFSIFYAVRIVYGTVHSQIDQDENIITTIFTALIFYGFVAGLGYADTGIPGFTFLFSFLAFFAVIILATSYRFYGRSLVFVAYPCTWLIFGVWFAAHYQAQEHLLLAVVFASVFFAIFYGATLVYRVVTAELGAAENTCLILTNSFIYWGFGYAILDSRAELQHLEGIFTAAHSVFHSIVAHAIGRLENDIADVVQTLTVLIITFATIAIPIQLDGNYVTLAWSVEAAILFYFGLIQGTRVFEWLSYPVMALSLLSLIADWSTVYQDRLGRDLSLVRRPFVNGDLITALVFVGASAFIYAVNSGTKDESERNVLSSRIFGRVVGGVGLFALYNALRIEIDNYFFFVAVNRGLSYSYSLFSRFRDLECMSLTAQLDFTILFLIILGLVNLQKVRSSFAALVNCVLGILVLGITSTLGMALLYTMRISYVEGAAVGVFGTTATNVLARYVTYALSAGLLFLLFGYSRSEVLDPYADRPLLRVAFDAVLYPFVFIVSSCELMNIAGQLHLDNADQYGLSILWGVYALIVVIIGIAWSKKYLRVGAMVVLAFTLAKLFFYDITDLGTIPKTILFISLGMLLLLVSFLYNKYKTVISGPEGEGEK